MCLVDTGAARSLIADNTFHKLCFDAGRPALVKPTGVVCGLGGRLLSVVGETEIAVSGVGIIRVLVTQNLPHELLLGSDAIHMGGGVMDYGNNTLHWYGHRFQLEPYTDYAVQTGAVHVKDTSGYASIDEVMAQYADVFDTTKLGHCDVIPFKMDTGDAHPIKQKAYRTPHLKRQIIDKQIDEMLEAGVIVPSASPWASPITLVPKKDGGTRFCVDYRKVNAVTRRDSYPLPLIQDIFDQLEGATLFSTLDLKTGFWQIPIEKSSQDKTAFTCYRGLFNFTRMPFGVVNAPSIFQRTMDRVLHGLIGKICFVFIDDIVVYSRDPADHASALQQVLDRLREAGLKAKPSKCNIACKEVFLLGYQISSAGIAPCPEKTSAIANMEPPRNTREVRRFLGMAGYYRQTVPGYAAIAAPLNALLRLRAKWEWTDQHEKAFRLLQQHLLSDNVLAFPQTNEPYALYTDACDYALGGILVQKDTQGVERVIQYVSHQFTEAERKWSTLEKEAYGVVYCLKKLRPYLFGATFEIFTDHKPLRALFQNEVANSRVQRWAVLIAEYGAPISYRKGVNNIRADMVSRVRPLAVDVVDTEDYVEPHTGTVTWSLPLQFDNIDKDQLHTAQKRDFPELWQRAQDSDDDDYNVQDGILFSCKRPGPRQARFPRVVLPAEWRDRVTGRCHSQTGHAGRWKTTRAVLEAYVWPGLRADVAKWLHRCGPCQIHKPHQEHVAHGRMPEPSYPFQIVSMDLTGPFTRSERGHSYLFTLIDHLTGFAEAYPIASKRGDTIADVLNRDFFPRYGPCELLVSDNGLEFVNQSVNNLCKAYDVKHVTTTIYHPQSNAKVERFHRTLKGILSRLISTTSSSWEAQLGPALSAYRNSVSAATGYTPYQALYGRQARLPMTTAINNSQNTEVFADDRLATLAHTWHQARTALRQERETNEELQRRKRLGQPLQLGDNVIVLLPGMKAAFQPRWDTRWQVIRARDPVYWIRHQQTGHEKVLNRTRLRWVPADIDWSLISDKPLNNQDRPQTRSQTLATMDGQLRAALMEDPPPPSQENQQQLGAVATDGHVSSTFPHMQSTPHSPITTGPSRSSSVMSGVGEVGDSRASSSMDLHLDSGTSPNSTASDVSRPGSSCNAQLPSQQSANSPNSASRQPQLPPATAAAAQGSVAASPPPHQQHRYPQRRRNPAPYFDWNWNPYISKRGKYSAVEWRGRY